MFFHDHAFGLTRLNVYAGEAAGYLLVDPVDVADELGPFEDLIHRVGDVDRLVKPLERVAQAGFDFLEERLAALAGDGDVHRLVAGGFGEQPFDVAVRVVQIAADRGEKRKKGQGDEEGQGGGFFHGGGLFKSGCLCKNRSGTPPGSRSPGCHRRPWSGRSNRGGGDRSPRRPTRTSIQRS